jgi:hypothetical protein
MDAFKGRITYESAENDVIKTYFITEEPQRRLFIIVGKTPEETSRELIEVRKLSEGAKIEANGNFDTYGVEEYPAVFCKEFELLE